MREVFRSCNQNKSPLSKLAKELLYAKDMGLTRDNNPVYNRVERFLDAMEKAKRVVLEKLGVTADKITIKILDIGGQKVCCYTHTHAYVNINSVLTYLNNTRGVSRHARRVLI